jgi:hypothetical protein
MKRILTASAPFLAVGIEAALAQQTRPVTVAASGPATVQGGLDANARPHGPAKLPGRTG